MNSDYPSIWRFIETKKNPFSGSRDASFLILVDNIIKFTRTFNGESGCARDTKRQWNDVNQHRIDEGRFLRLLAAVRFCFS